MTPTVLCLVVESGPDAGKKFRFAGGVICIGRAPTHEVALTDRGVSRHHGVVAREAKCWVITDIGSQNGTFVNGKRITAPWRLHDGDAIGVGGTQLRVYLEVAESEEDGPSALQPVPAGAGQPLDSGQVAGKRPSFEAGARR